jgi:concanavalin A-like lectin/glucanase superfamily protein
VVLTENGLGIAWAIFAIAWFILFVGAAALGFRWQIRIWRDMQGNRSRIADAIERHKRQLRLISHLCLLVGFLLMLTGEASAATRVAIWHMGSLGADGHTMVDTSHSSPPNDGAATDIAITAGFDGYGYGFNGTSSSVDVPDAASLDPGSQPISITLHVKFRSRPRSGAYDLISKGAAGGASYDVRISSKGKAVCAFTGSHRGGIIRGASALNDRHWHTIVCAKSTRLISITGDGVTRSTNVRVGAISNDQPLSVGAKSSGGSEYRGKMDEVTIRVG